MKNEKIILISQYGLSSCGDGYLKLMTLMYAHFLSTDVCRLLQ